MVILKSKQVQLIKVVGVGGGGGNAVNHMVANMVQQEFNGNFLGESAIDSEEHGKIVFYAVNTDAQALRKKPSSTNCTNWWGNNERSWCGANPNVGRKAAEDDQEEIRKMLWRCRHGLYRSRYGRWYRYWCRTNRR